MTPQADHEVAYELRKAFDKFVELRVEMRSRGFTVEHVQDYGRTNIPKPWCQNFDAIEIKKSTTVTY